ARRLLRGRGHRVDYGNLLTNLGAEAYFRGQWRECRSLWDRAAGTYRAAGDSTGLAVIANNLAELFFQQGRRDLAVARLAQARRVFASADDRYSLALNDSLRGTIAAWSGDLDEAAGHLRGSRHALAALGAEEFVLDADLRLLEVLLWRGSA